MERPLTTTCKLLQVHSTVCANDQQLPAHAAIRMPLDRLIDNSSEKCQGYPLAHRRYVALDPGLKLCHKLRCAAAGMNASLQPPRNTMKQRSYFFNMACAPMCHRTQWHDSGFVMLIDVEVHPKFVRIGLATWDSNTVLSGTQIIAAKLRRSIDEEKPEDTPYLEQSPFVQH